MYVTAAAIRLKCISILILKKKTKRKASGLVSVWLLFDIFQIYSDTRRDDDDKKAGGGDGNENTENDNGEDANDDGEGRVSELYKTVQAIQRIGQKCGKVVKQRENMRNTHFKKWSNIQYGCSVQRIGIDTCALQYCNLQP